MIVGCLPNSVPLLAGSIMDSMFFAVLMTELLNPFL